MNLYKSLAVIFILLSLSFYTSAQEYGKKDRAHFDEVQILRQEVSAMKQEIQQIRRMMRAHIQDHHPMSNIKSQATWSCYIKAGLNATFQANGGSKNEAKGKVLSQCMVEAKRANFRVEYCHEPLVNCGKH